MVTSPTPALVAAAGAPLVDARTLAADARKITRIKVELRAKDKHQ